MRLYSSDDIQEVILKLENAVSPGCYLVQNTLRELESR